MGGLQGSLNLLGGGGRNQRGDGVVSNQMVGVRGSARFCIPEELVVEGN